MLENEAQRIAQLERLLAKKDAALREAVQFAKQDAMASTPVRMIARWEAALAPAAQGEKPVCPICKGHSRFDECSCHYEKHAPAPSAGETRVELEHVRTVAWQAQADGAMVDPSDLALPAAQGKCYCQPTGDGFFVCPHHAPAPSAGETMTPLARAREAYVRISTPVDTKAPAAALLAATPSAGETRAAIIEQAADAVVGVMADWRDNDDARTACVEAIRAIRALAAAPTTGEPT